jgi:DNA-binding NtrC family response regulator
MAAERLEEQTIDQPRRSAGDGAFSLHIVEGPDAGASYVLDASAPVRVLVGTSPMATFRLSDAAISRRHASFRQEGDSLVVTDLSSTNGTSINGVKIREAILHGGEVVKIGSSVLTLKRGSARAPEPSASMSFGRVLGTSKAMLRLFGLLEGLAKSENAAFIEGEAGVGKELIAEELHARGPRAAHAFAVLQCHALSPAEIAERLVGPDGLIETVQGGTVYVDEVGAVPLAAQLRLLRAIEEPAANAPRLLFGTRRDLDMDVAKGRFREDLLDRLAGVRVEVPALRDRGGDVAFLANVFWDVLAAATPDREHESLPGDFMPRFESYLWPGNVRELSLAVAVRFNLGELGRWRTEALRGSEVDLIRKLVDSEVPLPEARKVVVEELERQYVSYMLARYGNTRDAAAASGVALRYFQLIRARSEG